MGFTTYVTIQTDGSVQFDSDKQRDEFFKDNFTNLLERKWQEQDERFYERLKWHYDLLQSFLITNPKSNNSRTVPKDWQTPLSDLSALLQVAMSMRTKATCLVLARYGPYIIKSLINKAS